MYHLIQDKSVFLHELTPGLATASLLSNVPVIPQDPTRNKKLLDLLRSLQDHIPIYELHFLPDNSFWNILPD